MNFPFKTFFKTFLIKALLFCMFYSTNSNAMHSSQYNDKIKNIDGSTLIYPKDNSFILFCTGSALAVISLVFTVYAKVQQNNLNKKIQSKKKLDKNQSKELDELLKKDLEYYNSYYYGSAALAIIGVVLWISALVEKNNSNTPLVELNKEGIRSQNKFISWGNLEDIIDSFAYIPSTRTQRYTFTNGQTATTEIPTSIPVSTVELISRRARAGRFSCQLGNNDISIKVSDLPISKNEFIEIIKTHQQTP